MEWLGFWIFLSVFVACDTWVFLSGFESFLHTAKTVEEKALLTKIREAK